ncbi:MAG TPA: hypothetical protein VN600_14295, partial [Gemmatimonadaceae bacterium]|nr:hypothetical protein [Gemmatimonadaceae bacterium]
FSLRRRSAPLDDIGRNRIRGPAKLCPNRRALSTRERPDRDVDSKAERACPPPNDELLEILHAPESAHAVRVHSHRFHAIVIDRSLEMGN